MTEEVLDIIRDTIKETVNGKIDKLTIQVNSIKDDIDEFHAKQDKKNDDQDQRMKLMEDSMLELKTIGSDIYEVVKGFKFVGKLLSGTAMSVSKLTIIFGGISAIVGGAIAFIKYILR